MATGAGATTKKVGKKKVAAKKTATRLGAAKRAADAAPRSAERVPRAPIASNDAKPEPVAAPANGEKQKLVRDSFTMPKSDYALLDAMKQRLLQRSKAVKKSELLRAGVATLAAMSDDELLATMDRVQSLKTGRPKKQKAAAKTSAGR